MNDNKKLVEHYSQKLWNQKDYSVIDQYISERVQITSTLGQTFGIPGMKQVVEKWFSAFPDLQCDFYRYVEEGDNIISYWRATGTHLGTFLNIPPTGKVIEYEGVTGYKIKDGKIIDYSAVVDMQQIITSLNND